MKVETEGDWEHDPFVAFDCPHYRKLIPNQLRGLARDVLNFLASCAFVCSITGNHMHSVALDEAHKMLVNKDLKTIVQPSKEYLDRMLYYYLVRSLVLNGCLVGVFFILRYVHMHNSAYIMCLDPSVNVCRLSQLCLYNDTCNV